MYILAIYWNPQKNKPYFKYMLLNNNYRILLNDTIDLTYGIQFPVLTRTAISQMYEKIFEITGDNKILLNRKTVMINFPACYPQSEFFDREVMINPQIFRLGLDIDFEKRLRKPQRNRIRRIFQRALIDFNLIPKRSKKDEVLLWQIAFHVTSDEKRLKRIIRKLYKNRFEYSGDRFEIFWNHLLSESKEEYP